MSAAIRNLVLLVGVLAFASLAAAQPSLKMMIPANPGGGWDQTGRQLATAMQSAKLVSGVQFDNKGGAAGAIGLAQFVNSAKGDPNSLMVAGMVMVGGVILQQSPVNLGMVTPVARLTSEWEVIVVPAASPHQSLGDLMKAFKENPGKDQLRRVQRRRGGADGHHRWSRDRGCLGRRRVRRADQGQAPPRARDLRPDEDRRHIVAQGAGRRRRAR